MFLHAVPTFNYIWGILIVISGIELAEKIKKGQFKFGKLGGAGARMPEIWRAALAA